jgi:lipoprotein-anchoring transpeptidase ErfK/SrfK
MTRPRFIALRSAALAPPLGRKTDFAAVGDYGVVSGPAHAPWALEVKHFAAWGVVGKVLLVVVSLLMLASAGAIAWTAVSDFQVRGLVTKGVTVVGQDLSGMTETQARSAIETAVATPLHRPVTVTGDKRTWTLDSEGIVAVDVDAMLNAAFAPRRTATFVTRVTHQLADEPLPADVKPACSIDSTAVSGWVDRTAASIDRKPRNATRKIVKYKFKITPAVYGAHVDKVASAAGIEQILGADAALSSASRVVTLPIGVKKPKVLESTFKTAIIVSLSQCKIRLYRGAKLVRTYRCAPGQPAYPTPTGDFWIESKLVNAPWINPHAAWSAGMPEVIGPGPSNPMGVRKIGINQPGVFMHGIPAGEYGSIGTHASHGCMRMMPGDVLDLFARVRIGDPVFIRD